jgi:DNA mismatch endonuclease (patch repair protein)
VRATQPKRNREFWKKKFSENEARDRRVISELKERGFDVVVLWECEVGSDALVAERLARLETSVRRKHV